MSLYIWKQTPGGRTCKDSAGLDQQIDTIEGWRNNVIPGSIYTACGGACDCKLIPASEGSQKSKEVYRVRRTGAGSGNGNVPNMSALSGEITAAPKTSAIAIGATQPSGVAAYGGTGKTAGKKQVAPL